MRRMQESRRVSKPRLRWNTGQWRLVKRGQHSDGRSWSMLDRAYILKPCNICGQEWIAHVSAQICRQCRPQHDAAQRRAIALANCAVIRGQLPSVKGQVCADCGNPACHYDHRDYSRPLDVQPTCRSCNRKRGLPAVAA